MSRYHDLFEKSVQGDQGSIARGISLIENESEDFLALLAGRTSNYKANVVGITGPPGAGKSTVADGLIGALCDEGKRVAVCCVDPSSPFHRGALLGDRIRMSRWYNHPAVFIRSLATRGTLGGLHPAMIDILSFLRACPFDEILLETAGVGQSEIEIAGLADLTMVVLVPEAGDDIQHMKSGLMEIADLFVVNKSDRPDADIFARRLKQMTEPAFTGKSKQIPVCQTVASTGQGIRELLAAVRQLREMNQDAEHRVDILTEHVLYQIRRKRMRDINTEEVKQRVRKALEEHNLNLQTIIQAY